MSTIIVEVIGVAVVTVDFDGTLFRGSSFKVMVRVARKEFSPMQWAVVSGGLVRATGLGVTKGKNAFRKQFFRSFAKAFRGKTRQELNGFFQRLVNIGIREVNQDLVVKIKEHQNKGDSIIVLSGALTPFLNIFIRDAGLDVHVISTELYFNEQDICTDVGTVINGQEKVKKVREWIANAKRNGEITDDEAKEIWAYADSESDIPLFEFAKHPIVVNPNNNMKAIANENNWPVLL